MSNMVVRTNVFALNAHRNLTNVGLAQRKSAQRLSSGFRVNSAADDAAGLAISESMRAQIRGLDQASINSQDAVGLIQTAEGAMATVSDMVIRIRELMAKAANDTMTFNSTSSMGNREMIQLEIDQLMQEINDVTFRTQFNTRTLLAGGLSGGGGGPASPVSLQWMLFDQARHIGLSKPSTGFLQPNSRDKTSFRHDIIRLQNELNDVIANIARRQINQGILNKSDFDFNFSRLVSFNPELASSTATSEGNINIVKANGLLQSEVQQIRNITNRLNSAVLSAVGTAQDIYRIASDQIRALGGQSAINADGSSVFAGVPMDYWFTNHHLFWEQHSLSGVGHFSWYQGGIDPLTGTSNPLRNSAFGETDPAHRTGAKETLFHITQFTGSGTGSYNGVSPFDYIINRALNIQANAPAADLTDTPELSFLSRAFRLLVGFENMQGVRVPAHYDGRIPYARHTSEVAFNSAVTARIAAESALAAVNHAISMNGAVAGIETHLANLVALRDTTFFTGTPPVFHPDSLDLNLRNEIANAILAIQAIHPPPSPLNNYPAVTAAILNAFDNIPDIGQLEGDYDDASDLLTYAQNARTAPTQANRQALYDAASNALASTLSPNALIQEFYDAAQAALSDPTATYLGSAVADAISAGLDDPLDALHSVYLAAQAANNDPNNPVLRQALLTEAQNAGLDDPLSPLHSIYTAANNAVLDPTGAYLQSAVDAAQSLQEEAETAFDNAITTFRNATNSVLIAVTTARNNANNTAYFAAINAENRANQALDDAIYAANNAVEANAWEALAAIILPDPSIPRPWDATIIGNNPFPGITNPPNPPISRTSTHIIVPRDGLPALPIPISAPYIPIGGSPPTNGAPVPYALYRAQLALAAFTPTVPPGQLPNDLAEPFYWAPSSNTPTIPQPPNQRAIDAVTTATRASRETDDVNSIYGELYMSRREALNADAIPFEMPRYGFVSRLENLLDKGLDALGTVNLESNAMWFQIGANATQGTILQLKGIHTGVLGGGRGDLALLIDVREKSGITISEQLEIIDIAEGIVNGQRAQLGAVQNRLEFTRQSLDISSENLSAAESRIRDADMALEMMRFTAAQVLQQAGISMLAQANQLPTAILQLLQ